MAGRLDRGRGRLRHVPDRGDRDRQRAGRGVLRRRRGRSWRRTTARTAGSASRPAPTAAWDSRGRRPPDGIALSYYAGDQVAVATGGATGPFDGLAPRQRGGGLRHGAGAGTSIATDEQGTRGSAGPIRPRRRPRVRGRVAVLAGDDGSGHAGRGDALGVRARPTAPRPTSPGTTRDNEDLLVGPTATSRAWRSPRRARAHRAPHRPRRRPGAGTAPRPSTASSTSRRRRSRSTLRA